MDAMKIFLAARAFVMGAAIVPASAADAKLTTNVPIEQCIRDNASKVELAVSDLNQAVDFLVSKLCVEPIAKENARTTKAQQQQYADALQKMCDDQKASQKNTTSDSKGAVVYDACSMNKIGFLSMGQYSEDDEPLFAGMSPPAAVALASRLLLDLRLSHSKSGRAN